MNTITKAAQEKGCIVGWDLAHAVGNVQLSLHDWNVDFACWCTYKYLNSSPGGIGGIFIHAKHMDQASTKALTGWWSNKAETRFDMNFDLDPELGAAAFVVSNPPPLLLCVNYANLEVCKVHIYSEKATKFCEIFTLLLTVCTAVKSKVKISQNYWFNDLLR